MEYLYYARGGSGAATRYVEVAGLAEEGYGFKYARLGTIK